MLFDCAGLTDKDIKLVIDVVKSEEADNARSKVIKIYTYETDLYKVINQANCMRDRSKIPTLGPYACLLFLSLKFEDEDGDSKLVKRID